MVENENMELRSFNVELNGLRRSFKLRKISDDEIM